MTRSAGHSNGVEAESLLGPDDLPPYEIINPHGTAPVLLTCEHAGRAVPKALGSLGMDAEDFDQHYAYDPGARDVTLRLAALLNAPALVGNYSRMVVDVGRSRNATAFPTVGEGKEIKGNVDLSEQAREERFKALYDPYHTKLNEMLDHHFLAKGVVPAMVSIHSFTPVFHGEARPWEVGILWLQDGRIPVPLMDHFRAKAYVVGDNQPYDIRALRGVAVVDRYADTRALPNVMVEFRNDLIRTPEDVETHTQVLYEGLQAIFADEGEGVFSLYDGPRAPEAAYDPEAEKAYFAKVMRTISATGVATGAATKGDQADGS